MSKQAQEMRLKLQPHTEFRIREIRSFVAFFFVFFVLRGIWKINVFSAVVAGYFRNIFADLCLMLLGIFIMDT